MTLRRPRLPKRAGWQLVELSFVLGAFAIISVAATRLIIGLMAIENRAGREVQDAAILDRLGDQWREDLHRASSATISNDAASLQLDFTAGKHVEYRIDGNKLAREQRDDSHRVTAREAYTVAARNWRFDRSSDGRMMTLVREFAPDALIKGGRAAVPSRVDTIEGAIGLLTRASAPEGASP
jgi:hypothetical protein